MNAIRKLYAAMMSLAAVVAWSRGRTPKETAVALANMTNDHRRNLRQTIYKPRSPR